MAKTTTTIIGHVDRAIDFFTKTNIFMGIAGQEPWEINPATGEETTDLNADATLKNLGRIIENEWNPGDIDPPVTGDDLEAQITELKKLILVKLTNKPFYIAEAGGTYKYTSKYILTVNGTGTAFSLSRFLTTGTELVTSNAALGVAREDLVQGLSIKVTAPTAPAVLAYFKNAALTFTVDAAFGFAKIEDIKLVREAKADGSENSDPNIITYRNQKWKYFTTAEDAYREETRGVYVKATFDYDNFPIIDFRQVGVFAGLTRATGVSATKDKLLPHEVQSTGVLHLVDFRSAIYRSTDQREVFAFIIEH